MTGPAATLAAVFTADGPRPELAEQLGVFAPLIGSWALTVWEYGPDDQAARSTAEWHFGWALDGRAVADVWINPPRAERGPDADGEWGLSLRFYDAALGAWRSTWHGPKRGWVIPFIGRRTRDEIILEGTRDRTLLRWIFSDLTPDSFNWRAEETDPAGTTRVRQRFEAVRMTPGQVS
jgi:hypothetical protein